MESTVREHQLNVSASPSDGVSGKFVPSFDGPIRGYVMNYLRKNYWRVQRSMEYEDVLQEAAFLVAYLANRYPDVDTPQWFMTLFKRSWAGHFAELAYKDSDVKMEVSPSFYADEEGEASEFDPDGFVGDQDNAGMLSIMIRNAPAEVKSVVSLFLNAPQEVLDLAAASWRSQGKKKEFGNTMLSKLLGLRGDYDAVEEVVKYFTK